MNLDGHLAGPVGRQNPVVAIWLVANECADEALRIDFGLAWQILQNKRLGAEDSEMADIRLVAKRSLSRDQCASVDQCGPVRYRSQESDS